MIIGSHVQMKAPDFIEGSVKEAVSYGANALMLYTGAPQNTRRRQLSEMHIAEAAELMKKHQIKAEHMIIHAPYLINPANSVKPEVAELAREFLSSEIERTHAIGAKYIVLHPGSYTTTNLETGIRTIISCLNTLDIPEGIVICLETMAGKGSEVGFRFEHLAEIISAMRQPEHFGVCLDTCHIHDAGYDVRDYDGVLDEFDRIIGLNRLHVIHLNDSKNEQGSRKDRHANLGQGKIGFDTLCMTAHHPRTAEIPKIIETPYIDGEPPYKEEIAMLKKKKFKDLMKAQ